jgi:hypothetical protein
MEAIITLVAVGVVLGAAVCALLGAWAWGRKFWAWREGNPERKSADFWKWKR